MLVDVYLFKKSDTKILKIRDLDLRYEKSHDNIAKSKRSRCDVICGEI